MLLPLYPHTGRCSGMVFHGPLRVPEQAAKGKAIVVLSIAEWKEVNVTPARLEVPIVDAPKPAKR